MFRLVALLLIPLVVALAAWASSGATAQSTRPLGDTGLFRVECDDGTDGTPLVKRATIDPIVFPGSTTQSHSHDFAGSFGVNAGSTNDQLREHLTSCLRGNERVAKKVPLNRSAMWVPTAYQNGKPVTFSDFDVTYRTQRRDPASIEVFPRDLRVIAGSSAGAPQPKGVYRWYCIGGTVAAGTNAVAPTCATDAKLAVSIRFPDCWDGSSSDSFNHQAHMAYSVRSGAPAGSGLAELKCPDTHPVAVPNIEFLIRYPTTGGPGFKLASTNASGLTDLTTTHADYMFGWDEAEFAHLVEVCLRADQYCGTARAPH